MVQEKNCKRIDPKFYERISKKKDPIIYGTGNQTRDFTYVEDTANGIMLADQTKNAIGDTFNIGQGKEESIKKIAKIVIKKYQEITGKEDKIGLTFIKKCSPVSIFAVPGGPSRYSRS